MTQHNRRELMRIGGISLAGLSLAELVGQPAQAAAGSDPTFGRAKNVIFLYLNGGPPQHETFDPKPDAPVEVRGVYQPIQTDVPGIQFCELLPRVAAIASKLAIVRSMSTDDNIHSSSGHWVLTGNKYVGPNARTIQSSDWPYFGSMLKRYRPSERMPALSTVMVPDVIRLNDNVTPAGQTGGLMGSRWSPERFIGDPSRADYKIEGLEPLGISADGLRQRGALQAQLEDRLRDLEGASALSLFNTYRQQAFDLLTSGQARRAFNIQEEPAAVRDRYGRNRWGQCVLLARRLIEAGVRLVHVNWPREPGDNAVDNPLWDTHAQNHDRLEDVLCPIFDVGFSALIEDLDQRGLLAETLVVAIGEFGRTPKINAKSGRDHWGSVFSFAMAGAGIAGGQVYGSSDKQGAYPASQRVDPGHMTATIFHLLGLDPRGTFTDPSGRELALSRRSPMGDLLGLRPATAERVESTGDVARVPAFDESRILANTDFAGRQPIVPAESPSRPKGWRTLQDLLSADQNSSGARLLDASEFGAHKFQQHVGLGLFQPDKDHPVTVAADARVLLGQEVRSPFAGGFRLAIELATDADSQQALQRLLAEFEFRMLYFQFMATRKQITEIKDLAALAFQPRLLDDKETQLQRIEFPRDCVNRTPGSNFSFGLGLGVGVEMRRKTSGDLQVNDGQAFIRLARVELEFEGKARNPDVTV